MKIHTHFYYKKHHHVPVHIKSIQLVQKYDFVLYMKLSPGSCIFKKYIKLVHLSTVFFMQLHFFIYIYLLLTRLCRDSFEVIRSNIYILSFLFLSTIFTIFYNKRIKNIKKCVWTWYFTGWHESKLRTYYILALLVCFGSHGF